MTSLPSRELRQDRAPIRLEPSDRVVIVAGSGQLPVAVAGSLRAAGHEPFVVMIAGERTDSHVFDTYENRTIELERHACRSGGRD
jgi:DUF1009 family protein